MHDIKEIINKIIQSYSIHKQLSAMKDGKKKKNLCDHKIGVDKLGFGLGRPNLSLLSNFNLTVKTK